VPSGESPDGTAGSPPGRLCYQQTIFQTRS